MEFGGGKLFTDGISKVTDEAGDVFIVNLENGVVTEVNPYTPSGEDDDDSEDKGNAKTEGEEETKPESEEEAKPESKEETKPESEEETKPEDLEDEKIQLKAKLTRERAVLSNELAKYEEDDNEGRLIILKQMNEIDDQIKALFEPAETQQKEIKIDWLKSDEETAKMTEAEIKVYKKSLSDRRGKASAAIKAGKNVAQNQQLLQIIDEAKLKLG